VGLSSAGIGSNLDVNSIVTQLMTLEQQPLTLLAKKEASYQAKLSGFGTLKGVLSQFQTAVSALSSVSKFQTMIITPADATIASASATGAATAGTYSLEVSKLAQSQKLATIGQSSASTGIGSGATTTINFDFGTIANGTLTNGAYAGADFTSNGSGIKSVTIDSNNSLSGIRDAINQANIGVSAAIVNDGGASPYRLVLTSTASGTANSLKISVAGDGDVATLLSHNPGDDAGQALSQTVTAQNAVFKLDGIDIIKSSNTVKDVISGVTLNLAKTNVGSPTSITVARDTASVVSSVNAFVKAYNDLGQNLKNASSFNVTTGQGAVLSGESTLRSIQAQLRTVLSAPLAGSSSTLSVLSQIGVTLQRDGSLAADSIKLQAAVDSRFSDFAGLFAAMGKSSDSLVEYSSSTSNTKAGAYSVSVTQLATKGSTVGTAAAGLVIDASNDTLEVLLDGVTATITLEQRPYADAAELAAEVQSKINGATDFSAAGASASVTETAGVLTITSNRYGSGSKASITGGSGQANLNVSLGTTGQDVAGSINGVAASGSGQFLTGATSDASEGLKIKIAGGSTGARGTINYSQGYAYQFDQMVTALLDTKGPIASRTDGINATLKSLAQSKQTISDRLVNVEKRYRAQFTALDMLMGKMSSTSNFLTQQLANLSNNS
jgi:flagellar hook-associated protein 2